MTTEKNPAMSTLTRPRPAAAERRVPPLGGFNLTLLQIELRRRLRNKRTVFFTVAFPVIMFLLIGAKYANEPVDPGQPLEIGGTSVAAYAMISFAVYGAMLASTAAGGAVALERALGWSRQLRITPLTPAANIAVKILGGLVLGLLAVLATFAAGAATGVRMPWQVWILAGL